MDRLGKILIVAGLLVLLCAPALAAAQPDRPVKTLPCASPAPVIDGKIEPKWENYAHWQDITVDFEMLPKPSQGDAHPYGVELGLMHGDGKMYMLLAEYWSWSELQLAEGNLYSVFCMGFEDQPPSWEWNVKDPEKDSGEGWLCFVGGQGFHIDEASAQDWTELESIAFFIGRVGGDQETLCDCFDGLWVDSGDTTPEEALLEGVKHAFAVYHEGIGGQEQLAGPDHLMWVHEIAIDLTKSPLNPTPEDRFRAWFGSFGLGPALIGPAELGSEQSLRAIAETIGCSPEQFLLGLWPGGRGMVDPTDEPEDQAKDMLEFLACCEQYGAIDPSCDWCIPCFGKVEMTPCGVVEEVEEFVPEPGTLLLLGSGLMGLGGYATLRWRRRE